MAADRRAAAGSGAKPGDAAGRSGRVSNAVVVKKTDKVSGELKRRLTVVFRGPNSRIAPPP